MPARPEYKFAFIQKGRGQPTRHSCIRRQSCAEPRRSAQLYPHSDPRTCTSACPPYHLAIVIGGTRPNSTENGEAGLHPRAAPAANRGQQPGYGWRDLEWEAEILQITRDLGIAQFKGKWSLMCALSARRDMAPPARSGLAHPVLRPPGAGENAPDGIFVESWNATRHASFPRPG